MWEYATRGRHNADVDVNISWEVLLVGSHGSGRALREGRILVVWHPVRLPRNGGGGICRVRTVWRRQQNSHRALGGAEWRPGTMVKLEGLALPPQSRSGLNI